MNCLVLKLRFKRKNNSTQLVNIGFQREYKKIQNYLNLPHFHDSRENMKEELTAIGKELLKDLLECVFVHLSIWALLFKLGIFSFESVLLSCLNPLYIFLISCLLNLVSRTCTKRSNSSQCQEVELFNETNFNFCFNGIKLASFFNGLRLTSFSMG